jgi:hypothetical protein
MVGDCGGFIDTPQAGFGAAEAKIHVFQVRLKPFVQRTKPGEGFPADQASGHGGHADGSGDVPSRTVRDPRSDPHWARAAGNFVPGSVENGMVPGGKGLAGGEGDYFCSALAWESFLRLSIARWTLASALASSSGSRGGCDEVGWEMVALLFDDCVEFISLTSVVLLAGERNVGQPGLRPTIIEKSKRNSGIVLVSVEEPRGRLCGL